MTIKEKQQRKQLLNQKVDNLKRLLIKFYIMCVRLLFMDFIFILINFSDICIKNLL